MDVVEMLEAVAKAKLATSNDTTATVDIPIAVWTQIQEWMQPRQENPICSMCQCPITPGTYHTPFNGNQMFACEVALGEAPAPPSFQDNLMQIEIIDEQS